MYFCKIKLKPIVNSLAEQPQPIPISSYGNFLLVEEIERLQLATQNISLDNGAEDVATINSSNDAAAHKTALSRLQNYRSNCLVISRVEKPEAVAFGSLVKIVNSSGDEDILLILGPVESYMAVQSEKFRGVIASLGEPCVVSSESPAGTSLIGSSIGQVCTFTVGEGEKARDFNYTVCSFEHLLNY